MILRGYDMHPLSPVISTNHIITFHTVFSKQWFKRSLEAVNKIYKFISAEDIELYYYGNKKFNTRCHICFDDGDRTVYDHAFPVLKAMGIPATLFVSPKIIKEGLNYWFQDLEVIIDRVDDASIKTTVAEYFDLDLGKIENFEPGSLFKSMQIKDILKLLEIIKEKYDITIDKRFNMSEDELVELKDSKIFTIGPHTMNHPILSNEDDAVAEQEIQGSKVSLSKMLGENVKYFAYPNGSILDFGTREQKLLKKSKIRLAFTTTMDFFNKKNDPYSIPRGGFSRVTGRYDLFLMGKLILIPVWDSLKESKVQSREINERKVLRELSLF